MISKLPKFLFNIENTCSIRIVFREIDFILSKIYYYLGILSRDRDEVTALEVFFESNYFFFYSQIANWQLCSSLFLIHEFYVENYFTCNVWLGGFSPFYFLSYTRYFGPRQEATQPCWIPSIELRATKLFISNLFHQFKWGLVAEVS